MPNDFQKCKRCGNIFRQISKPYCNECLDIFEEEFTKVKGYLYDHPSAKIDEVSEETEVDIKVITEFVKQERLIFADPVLQCKVCGKSISKGDTCDSCKEKLRASIMKSMPSKSESTQTSKDYRDKDAMHTGRRKY